YPMTQIKEQMLKELLELSAELKEIHENEFIIISEDDFDSKYDVSKQTQRILNKLNNYIINNDLKESDMEKWMFDLRDVVMEKGMSGIQKIDKLCECLS